MKMMKPTIQKYATWTEHVEPKNHTNSRNGCRIKFLQYTARNKKKQCRLTFEETCKELKP